jgi:3,4-dihydroxy-2-butanone 4-phosphate synthase
MAVGFASAPVVGDDFTAETSMVASALAEFASGRPVVLLPTGVSASPLPRLVVAAGRIEPAEMAFMVRHTSGFVCVRLPTARCDELVLPIFANDKCLVGEPLPGVSVDVADATETLDCRICRARRALQLADASWDRICQSASQEGLPHRE